MTANTQNMDEPSAIPTMPDVETLIALMLHHLSDGLDHPDLWADMPVFCNAVPELRHTLARLHDAGHPQRDLLLLLHAMCLAAANDVATALSHVAPLGVRYSQSALIQGALFYLHGLADPDNPKYRLAGKICPTPFEQLDVLERSTHQCCASWLQQSAGDLMTTPWQDVWNSEAAQAVRASVLDGTYRFCNKTACPKIQANALTDAKELAGQFSFWAEVIEQGKTALDHGPKVINLAYDRTCNLACPSCRSEPFAADDATRDRFAEMQETKILPMLKHAEIVFVTGSGDPFASKNFRKLLGALTPEAYPNLRFQIMTNGMLFTPRQWEEFPSLHGRVKILKISTDAATGPTHEKLRLGARWPTMLDNMRFAGDLTAKGLVDHFEIVFTVQQDNYREMGDVVDLAKELGATGIYFARLTNWGTFTAQQYAEKAVFLPAHPEHTAFLEAMQDPRLRDPIVLLGDLAEFLPSDFTPLRTFVH